MKKNFLIILIFSALAIQATEGGKQRSDEGPSILKPLKAKKSMFANLDGEPNIAIKINLSQLAFKNLSLQAEYGFHKKLSVALGISSLLKRDLPGFVYDPDPAYADYFKVPNLKGFAVTPELRFYPGGKEEKPAPRGFYLAPYLRFAKYTVEQEVSYQDDSKPNQPIYSATTQQTYGGYTAGLMIGQQWIIAKHFTIDWWIIGAGYGKAKYTYSWKVPGANLTDAQQADVKEQAESNFDSFSALGLTGTVETTPNSAKTTVSGLRMVSIRFMGLCLGYSF
jgi:hypothetical protein